MKNLRVFLLVAFSVLISMYSAVAQGIFLGGRVGPGLSSYRGKINFPDIFYVPAEGFETTENIAVISSFYGGITANIRVSDVFSIQPELLYAQQGATAEREMVGEDFNTETKDTFTTTLTYNINYFKIPVLFKYYVVGKVGSGLGLYLGPQLSFKISEGGTIKYEEGGIVEEFELEEKFFKGMNEDGDEIDEINNLDAGFIVGVDYEFDFGLSAGLRYDMGLLEVYNQNIVSDYQDIVGEGGERRNTYQNSTYQNHTISLSLAYLSSLGK